jgi:hypothetical protein
MHNVCPEMCDLRGTRHLHFSALLIVTTTKRDVACTEVTQFAAGLSAAIEWPWNTHTTNNAACR